MVAHGNVSWVSGVTFPHTNGNRKKEDLKEIAIVLSQLKFIMYV